MNLLNLKLTKHTTHIQLPSLQPYEGVEDVVGVGGEVGVTSSRYETFVLRLVWEEEESSVSPRETEELLGPD